MSKKDNKKEQLGCEFGTTCNRLRKSLLFFFAQKLDLDICFRCGQKIEKIEDFSIDHKIDWLHSENPIDFFYDLDNIGFSHLKCNMDAGSKCRKETRSKTGFKGVTYDPSGRHKKPYRAIIERVIDGNTIKYRLGRYETAREAALAYDEKAKDIFKDKAFLNFGG